MKDYIPIKTRQWKPARIKRGIRRTNINTETNESRYPDTPSCDAVDQCKNIRGSRILKMVGTVELLDAALKIHISEVERMLFDGIRLIFQGIAARF